MGQKLLFLLDSNMTRPCKKMIFSPSWQRTGTLHALSRRPALNVAVKRLREGFESGGQWVRSHPGTLANVILTLPSAKTDVGFIQILSFTLKVARGPPLCFAVSSYLRHCINVRSKNVAPEKSSEPGEHQFIISPDLEMNILARTHVAEPEQSQRDRIVMHESGKHGRHVEQSIRGLDKD